MTGNETIRRDRMIRELAARGIVSTAVLRAMNEIPRERFVEEALRGKAYSDVSLPIGETQTISQPWIVARMSELLEPTGRGKVLEIGSGSGYQAGVLSRLFELVYSVERSAELSRRAREAVRELRIQNVHFKIFDGSYGWSEFAPYRAVLVTAAAPTVPTPLIEQLEVGGRLVLPLSGPDGRQVLTRVIKTADGLSTEQHGPCRFVPLVGRYGVTG
jgi:protein-L-isoaspartate(D-aspartate) O-methyltransferase